VDDRYVGVCRLVWVSLHVEVCLPVGDTRPPG
jgi:hypothetical protein